MVVGLGQIAGLSLRLQEAQTGETKGLANAALDQLDQFKQQNINTGNKFHSARVEAKQESDLAAS